MKLKAIITALLFGLTAQALDVRSYSEALGTSAAAPTAASTGGFDLTEVTGFRVSVCAESGQTLSGAGTIAAYLKNNITGLIERNPGLDLAITVTGTSCAGAACRCQVFPDMQVTGSDLGGTYFPRPSGVTVSGGTTVTVRVDGIYSRKR